MGIYIIDCTVFSYRLIAQRNENHLYFVTRSYVTYEYHAMQMQLQHEFDMG